MPTLTPGDVHVNALLTNVGLRWKNTSYIGDQICPIVPVKNKTDVYATWGKSAWFRDEARGVAPGASAPRVGMNVTLTNTYTCETYKIAYPLPRELKANADSALQLQARATEICTDKIMLAREIRASTMFFEAGSPSNWSYNTTLSGNDQWNNYTAGDSSPVTDIDTGIASVEDESAGLRANTIVMGVAVWRKVRRHPEIIELVFGGGYSDSKIVTPDLFAKAFEVDRVLIGRAMYTTDEEDTDDSGITYSNIWGKHCWIGHVTSTPSALEPSAAYMFREFFRVRSWYDDDTDTDFIEASESIDEVLISASCGYLIAAAVA